jgi:hypothetical protein
MGLGGKESSSPRPSHETSAGSVHASCTPKENSFPHCDRGFENEIEKKSGFELEPIFCENTDFEADFLESFIESHFGLINGAGRRFSRE